MLLAGSANRRLASGIAQALGTDLAACALERFPDGELHVQVTDGVRGADVFVIEPTGPPVDEHLVELALLVDAAWRAGAARLTAVVPYFGYARQDRRSRAGEALGARVAAALLAGVHVDRLLVVDPHSAALEPMSPVRVEAVSAVPDLAAVLRPLIGSEAVLVAPDLGAVKLAERYAIELELPIVVVRKQRMAGDVVRAMDVIGELRDRAPVIVDDMISSGATIQAAVDAVMETCRDTEVLVAATHGLFVGSAYARLARLPLRGVLVTDSVAAPGEAPDCVQTVSIGHLLAEAIRRLHEDEPLGELASYR